MNVLKLNYEIIASNKYNVNYYNIEQADILINNVISININNDINNLTQTAEIKLPLTDIILPNDNFTGVSYKNSNFKILFGDNIIIKLGYNGHLEKVFYGYFTDISIVKDGVILKLQDRMYYWKKATRIQFSHTNITIQDLLIELGFSQAFPETWDTDNIINFTLPKIRTSAELTPAEVLKMLKDNYNFYAYYMNDKLIVGHKYPLTKGDELIKIYSYPYKKDINTQLLNSIHTTQEKSYPVLTNNLVKEYKSEKLLSVVNVTQGDNSKDTYFFTNDTEQVQKVTNDIPLPTGYDNKIVLNETDLTEDAAKELCMLNYDNAPKNKYTGNFVTLGTPLVTPTDTIFMILNSTGQTNGINDEDLNYYLVEKVIHNFDISKGYKQTVSIDANYQSLLHIYKN